MRRRYTRSGGACRHLLGLSALSTVNESSFQLALLFELALVTRRLGAAEVAAYAAVAATTTCALGLFSFLLVTTMAQIAHSSGAERWHEIGPRFRVALLSAVSIGVACGAALWALEAPLFARAMALDAATVAEIRAVFPLRLALLPLMMVQRVCSGLLGGYHRVRWLAARTVAVALVEVCSQWLALYVFNAGLFGATVGAVATAAFGAGLSLVLVACLPPPEARGQIRLCCCDDVKDDDDACGCCRADDDGQGGSVGKAAAGRGSSRSRRAVVCWDFASASKDTVIRSLLLTLSVYSMTLFAASLGTAQLTAHQVAMTLWMFMSLICDGIADVGTMVSAKLLGEGGRTAEIRAVRDMLLSAGMGVGVVVSVSMWVCRDRIVSFFALAEASQELLLRIWPLLCGMQTVNAAVFVLDGFIYGVQAFSFVRNLMLLACVGWFGPALLCVDVPAVVGWRSLLGVWCAKAGLNAIRAAGAVYLLYFRLPKRWRREEQQADAGVAPGALASPLL